MPLKCSLAAGRAQAVCPASGVAFPPCQDGHRDRLPAPARWQSVLRRTGPVHRSFPRFVSLTISTPNNCSYFLWMANVARSLPVSIPDR